MNTFQMLSFLIVIITLSQACVGKGPKSSKDFKIDIVYDKAGFHLNSDNGATAWKELSFDSTTAAKRAIDAFGMMTIGEYSKSSDQLKPFRFTISKKENTIILLGQSGTNWDTLTFECPNQPCRGIIDKKGVFVPNQ